MIDIEKELVMLLQRGDLVSPNISELAKFLKTSSATVHRKIKKLEEGGIIREYVAHVDARKLGKAISAFVRVQIEYPKEEITHADFIQKYVDHLLKQKEIQEIYIPVGEWDLILKVKTKDIEDQYRFISEVIMPMGNIRRVESIISMKTLKESSYVSPD